MSGGRNRVGAPSPSGGRSVGALAVVALASLAGAGSGCTPFPDFPPESLVDSVRILAVRADKPYAAPGDMVRFDVLAADGRPERPAPMRVFWVPVPCDVPVAQPDLCYSSFTWQFQPGVDASQNLHEGDSLSVLVPPDQLTSEGGSSGLAYRSMFVFLMACAGHVEYLGSKAGRGLGAVPFGCFDEAGARLGGLDFVFAFARVLVIEGFTNQNPAMDGLEIDSAPVDLDAGITLPRCTAKEEGERCPVHALTLLVPRSSQEVDSVTSGGLGEGGAGSTSTDTGAGTGNVVREALWASFYTTLGETSGAALSLYDPSTDEEPFPTSGYSAPKTAGEGSLFAIVRDSRGGVNWLRVPLHIQ